MEKPPTRLPFGKLYNLRPINTTTNSIDQSDKNDMMIVGKMMILPTITTPIILR